MNLKIGKVKIRITFAFALFVAFAVSFEDSERLYTAFSGAFMHECVHLVFLLCYGCNGIEFILNPGGACIKCAGTELLPERKQLIILLSAPVANLLTGVSVLYAGKLTGTEILISAGTVNLLLGTVNLLPLVFLDGGRSLKIILESKLGEALGGKICFSVHIIFLFAVLIVSFFVIVRGYKATGIVLFALYCLLYTIVSHRRFVLK